MQKTYKSILSAAKSWPFQEAQKILKHIRGKTPKKGYVLFETGYGPSGLPHIGTFAEVVRTTMVMNAFRKLTLDKIPVKLICFSDDMDGLRKIPSNIPNAKSLEQYLHFPLTSVKDPFGCCQSFGHHNNKQLCNFLDRFNFTYTLVSATECYTSGKFNISLLKILKHYSDIQKIILPTLGKERQKTYSLFLPICQDTGRILQAKVTQIDSQKGTITYQKTDNTAVETPITNGNVKLQWKPDWAMRWYALGVDYEICGKDLKPSLDISRSIIHSLGASPPENLIYELFLDEKGEKISKSKGNGLSIEQWLKYSSLEDLSLYMYKKPKVAKKNSLAIIPQIIDEYLAYRVKYHTQNCQERYDNPIYHIHRESVPQDALYNHKSASISFNLLLNLIQSTGVENPKVIWGLISRHTTDLTPKNSPKLDQIIRCAIRYYQDCSDRKKKFRNITPKECDAVSALKLALSSLSSKTSAQDIQEIVFTVGKDYGYVNLREWFKVLYEVLLGRSHGPRMGGFIALYGIQETIDLIDKSLNKNTGIEKLPKIKS